MTSVAVRLTSVISTEQEMTLDRRLTYVFVPRVRELTSENEKQRFQ